jgi:hypothetical protein
MAPYSSNEVLECFDWSKYDHHVLFEEHIMLQDAMMQVYEEEFKNHLPDLRKAYEVCDNSRRKQRITTVGGTFDIDEPNGQDSGRYSTLVGNSMVTWIRMAVLHLGHENLLEQLFYDRGDDVIRKTTWDDTLMFFSTFIYEMNQVANVKKQKVQYGNGIYFRAIYANGAVVGQPTRSIYSVASCKPAIAVGQMSTHVEKMRSQWDACMRAVRRGWEPIFCKNLYDAYETWLQRGRLWWHDDEGNDMVYHYHVSKIALRAAVSLGGHGIPEFGMMEPQYSWKVERKKVNIPYRKDKMSLPGVVDIVKKAMLDAATFGVQIDRDVYVGYMQEMRSAAIQGDGTGYHRRYAGVRLMLEEQVETIMMNIDQTIKQVVRKEKVYVKPYRITAAGAVSILRWAHDEICAAQKAETYKERKEVYSERLLGDGAGIMKRLAVGILDKQYDKMNDAEKLSLLNHMCDSVRNTKELRLMLRSGRIKAAERFVRDGVPLGIPIGGMFEGWLSGLLMYLLERYYIMSGYRWESYLRTELTMNIMTRYCMSAIQDFQKWMRM